MTPAELREARQTLGLSQDAMAEALSVGRRNYIRWEMGDARHPGPLELAVKYLLHVGALAKLEGAKE